MGDISIPVFYLMFITLTVTTKSLLSIPVSKHSESNGPVTALNVNAGPELQKLTHASQQGAGKKTVYFTPETALFKDRHSTATTLDQRGLKSIPNHFARFSNGYVSSTHGDKNQNHKLRQVQEKSDTLIKRLCNVKGKTAVCFQQGQARCHCKGGLADCSGKPFVPNLSYVPKFQPEIKCLRFNYNNVPHFDDSYFANISDFLVVDFSNNKLETISDKTFQRFHQLKYLMLNYNDVSYKYLKLVLKSPPQLRLDIIGLQLRELPNDYFKEFQDIPTSQIFMDFNFMPNLDLREFSVLKNLKYLSLTNSSISNITTTRMPNLKVLDLDFNRIKVFPASCSTGNTSYQSLMKDSSNSSESGYTNKYTQVIDLLIKSASRKRETQPIDTTLFPRLEELYLGINEISALPQEICLPNLVTLHLERNRISELRDNAFTSFHSLKLLILDRMEPGISKIGSSAFGIPSLTSLFLSKASIDFSSDQVSMDMFNGSRCLVDLYIDHNNLRGVNDSDLWRLFHHAPHIRYLYMGSTSITYIPTKAFSLLKELRFLYIYINDIEEIPHGAFDVLPSLQGLYMDQNRISTIRQNTFSPETRSRLQHINLSKNNFLCDCDLRWFRSWLNESGSRVFMDYNLYICSNIPNEPVQNYTLSQQACLLSRATYIVFVVCLSILMTAFIVFALVYRYRWHIKLALYQRRALGRENALAATTNENRFDVFVVYCNDNTEWVVNTLLPVIEEDWGLRTCIHSRDFAAGGFIIDNIVDSMQNSTRIMVVISSRFALSKWCNLELILCQSHMITHDLPSLFVIKLDEIEARDMSAAMFALYNTTCFLELPTDHQDMPTFWRRLRRNLKLLIEQRVA